MKAVVETRDLSKRFGENHALAGLTMTVPQGRIVGFLGRNGSGKTTTIKILLDLIRRTSGEATVLGEPTGSVAVRRRIGFLGEDKRLYSYMTVRGDHCVHASVFSDSARGNRSQPTRGF